MTNRKIRIRYEESRGCYVARFTEDGKRKSLYGESEEEVRQKLIAHEKSIRDMTPGSRTAVFEEYFLVWLHLKKEEVRPNSYRRYESLWETHISKAPFVDKPMPEVAYSDLKAFYASLATGGASQRTVTYIHTLVKAAFLSAMEDRLIDFNPTTKIKFKANKSKKAKALTKEEQLRLVRYLNFNIDDMGELILFDLGTGLRLGEALALRWSDIDMEKGIVRVARNLQRVLRNGKYVDEESVPKTHHSIRSVPLPAPIHEMLKKRQKFDSSLVFQNEKGGYVFNKKPLRHLQALCKLLKLRDITFHDLRHSYATRLFEAGVPIKAAQVLLGHSDISITAGIYTHVMADVTSNEVAKLDDLFR